MANIYADTVLQNARAQILEQENKRFELRPTDSNITNAWVKGRSHVMNLAEIRKATTQTTQVYYHKNKNDYTVTTTKSNSPSGEMSGTGIATVSWAEYVMTLKLPVKQYHGNEISREEGWAINLYQFEKQFWPSFDENVLLPSMLAHRSAVNEGDGDAYGSTFTDSVMYTSADYDKLFYELVKGHMLKNDYKGGFIDIHDTMWSPMRDYYMAQGAGNQENLAWQNLGATPYYSNAVSPREGTKHRHFIIPEGGVALLDWNDPVNRGLHKPKDGFANAQWGTYQSLFHPELTLDYFAIESVADSSDDGGYLQDPTLNIEFALTYALFSQPIERTSEDVVFEYAGNF